jgi:hypothetical protein
MHVEYEYLLVAQYIFNKYTINIHADNELILKHTCTHGHYAFMFTCYKSHT